MVIKTETSFEGNLGEIIERTLKEKSIFKDLRAFNQNFIPPSLPCCQEIIAQLSRIFRPFFEKRGGLAVRVSVTGKAGVGKTTIVRRFCEQLKMLAEKFDIKMIHTYYNCHAFRSRSSILRDILIRQFDTSPRGYSCYELLNFLNLRLERENQHLILVLDEANVLGVEQILSTLHATDDRELKKSRISTILISRPAEMQAMLEGGLSERINDKIRIASHSKDELREILRYRASLGFNSGVISEKGLEEIATLSGERGSVRHGLDLLLHAGKLATSMRKERITVDIVRAAWKGLHPQIPHERLMGLNLHELLTLFSIASHLYHSGIISITIKEVYEGYWRSCKDYSVQAHSVVTFRKHVKMLARRDILEYETRPIGRRRRGARGRIALNGSSARMTKQQVGELLLKQKKMTGKGGVN